MADDAPECVTLRGRTRENPISPERLASHGITAQSWGDDIASGHLPGHVCLDGTRMVGYGFGDMRTGEVVVLALLPSHEFRGIGKELLSRVVLDLRCAGHQRLFLGCSPDAATRSHGFYRHLGWRSTGTWDRYGDEILELTPAA
jgi:GNAT superfamily N-acetyltransferase